MNWRTLSKLFLVVVCAALAFGGSFECRSSTHDDVTDNPKPRSNR